MSFEGGVLKSSHLQHTNSSLSSKFRPPQDYNLYNWLIKKLNIELARRRMRGRENVHSARVKKWALKIVESRSVKQIVFLWQLMHQF